MDQPFDIEQDNNPSLYGNSFHYFNSSLSISSTLNSLLLSDKLTIKIESTEKLINSSIIVYLIEIYEENSDKDKIVVKRRYSEFKSFRENLLRLYPTVIFPPIPEKHSLLSYFWNSLNTNNEFELIEFRKRYFNNFLNDLCKHKHLISSNQFIAKFFDPNYELCWNNALMEPPINSLPKNMLLSNPINPADQNGLYLLLPKIHQFSNSSFSELYKLNLDSLSSINNSILKLNNQCNFNKFPQNKFHSIPDSLINFETYVHSNLKILVTLNKYNIGNIKSFKQLLSILINLGGNLNNCSLEIYEINLELSNLMEKFGSIIDSNYLNYEKFLLEVFIPQWYELINQLYQYYNGALNLINFFKFKIFQFLILFKTKFKLVSQYLNLVNSTIDLNHLAELNSPSINKLIKKRSLNSKKSWYKIFGGNKPTLDVNDSISDTINQTYEYDRSFDTSSKRAESITSGANDVQSLESNGTQANGSSETHNQHNDHKSGNPEIQYKINHLEKELVTINNLIEVLDTDLSKLTEEVGRSLTNFNKLIEHRWCWIFLTFIQSTRVLFTENLKNWQDFKSVFE